MAANGSNHSFDDWLGFCRNFDKSRSSHATWEFCSFGRARRISGWFAATLIAYGLIVYVATIFGIALFSDENDRSDKQEAVRLMLVGAYAGIPPAEFLAGKALFDGVGIDQDKKRGLYWIRAAAHQGQSYAMAALGDIYQKGDGVAADLGQAAAWYEAAASAGHARAKLALGIIYQIGGKGLPQDISKAADFSPRSGGGWN